MVETQNMSNEPRIKVLLEWKESVVILLRIPSYVNMKANRHTVFYLSLNCFTRNNHLVYVACATL
jgi:hypothetical protein